MYYISTGIPTSVLAPLSHHQMMNIMHLLPPEKESSEDFQIMKNIRGNLEEEVKRDYYLSLKKSIGMKQHKKL